ncbi:MAG TPA: GtrA family protein [Anaeromyxobacteraceae bacterium]|nr:GtrA family protein [Anaeromyxobacteraceae bacterium]
MQVRKRETGAPHAARSIGRLVRFAAVGASGIVVNLAALWLLAGVLDVPEIAASAVAIELSILSNFAFNDRFTFGDRRGKATLGHRLLRYHAVSFVGFALQLGIFVIATLVIVRAGGRAELGDLRYVAQSVGIVAAFAWNYTASVRWAWGPAVPVAAVRPSRLPVAAFGLLLFVHVLPLWLLPYVPTQDGPLHVENVLGLLAWERSPLLQQWYVANWGVQPNWLTQAILAGLLQALPPVAAEKAILTGYTVFLPFAFRAALPRGERGWWIALGVFPFVHAYPFHMGFWNFCWGVALLFATTAFWLRRRGRLGPAAFAAVAVLAVLLFLAHTVAFAAWLATTGILLAWRAALSLRRARGRPARVRRVTRGYALRGAGLAAAALPGVVLVASWIADHSDRAVARLPWKDLAAKLATLYALVSIDRKEIFLAAGVAFALGVATVHVLLLRTTRLLRPQDGWLLGAIAFAILYFAVPDVIASGAHVSDRMALLSGMCVLAFVGSSAGASIASIKRAGIALGAVAVLFVGARTDKQHVLASYVEEFVSAARAVDTESVLLPVAFLPHGPRDDAGRRLGYRIKPFLHATGWIVAERGGVDLKNSQANTDHCPLRFPEDRNPFRVIAPSLAAMEGAPPCVPLSRASNAVDYVLVWGNTPEGTRTPCAAAMHTELGARFERVFVSEPRGLLEVWRPRPAAAVRGAGAPPDGGAPVLSATSRPERRRDDRNERGSAPPPAARR